MKRFDYYYIRFLLFKYKFMLKNKIYIAYDNTDLLHLEVYKKFSKLFDKDVYKFIDLETCVNRRISLGGASPKNIDRQIAFLEK